MGEGRGLQFPLLVLLSFYSLSRRENSESYWDSLSQIAIFQFTTMPIYGFLGLVVIN